MRRGPLPKPTLLDRAIGIISPRALNERLSERVKTARYMAVAVGGRSARGGYDAADRGRRQLQNARRLDTAADGAILPALEELRMNAADLVRNNPLATGALDTIATKVVGPGLQLRANPDAEYLGLTEDEALAYKKTFHRLWRHLAARLDYTRRFSLPVYEYLSLHSQLEFGDCFVVKTGRQDPGDLFNLKCQFIEAGRVSNPGFAADSDKISGGIEFDDNGVPIAVHITNRYPLDYSKLTAAKLQWTRVALFGTTGRRNVIQLMAPSRLGTTRGVPLLAPVIEELKQLGDYTEAELMAAVVNSCFAVVAKTMDGSGSPETDEQQPAAGDFNRIQLTFEPGTVIEGLAPNESISSFTPNRPSATFDPFFTAICRQIAVALGLSFELLVRHFTASYSASRAALMQVFEIVVRRRGWLSAQLHQDLFEEMLGEAHERGTVTLRGWTDPLMRDAWCRAKWTGPSQGQLNPKDEVQAAALAVGANFSTEEEQTAALNGGDWDENMEQRAREVERSRALGLSPAIGITGNAAGQSAAAPPPDNQGPGSDQADQPQDD